MPVTQILSVVGRGATGGGGGTPQPAGLYAWEWDSDSFSTQWSNTAYNGAGSSGTTSEPIKINASNGWNTVVTPWPNGNSGTQAYGASANSFLQTADFIQSAYSAAWASGTRTGLTIELWFYPIAGARTLVSEQGAGGVGIATWHDNIIELNSNGTVVADIWPYTGGPITTANSVNYNAWNHLIYTYNVSTTTLSLQLNGGTVVSNSSKPWQSAVENGGGGLYYAIGYADATNLMANANTTNFDGRWGKIRIANYPMASNRVSDWAKYNSFSIVDSLTSLGTSWSVEVVGEFFPSQYWATIWGNESWDAGLGHLAYFTGPDNLAVGRPNAQFEYTMTQPISTRAYWVFTHTDASGNTTYTSSNWTTADVMIGMGSPKLIFTDAAADIQAIPVGTVISITTSEGTVDITTATTYGQLGSGMISFTFNSTTIGSGTLISMSAPSIPKIDVYRNGVLLTPYTSNYTQPSVAGNTLLFGARHGNGGTGTTDSCPGNYLYTNITASALPPATITSNFTTLQGTYNIP